MTVQIDAQKRIKELKNSLASEGILTGTVDKKQYNFEFTAEDETGKLKVLVYFGKKGVKTVLQGNADSTIYNRIESIISGNPAIAVPKQELDEPEIYIGSDETGKGDFFGPLTVAAVYVNQETSDKLKSIGVCDSKNLTDPQINKLAQRIHNIIDGDYDVLVLEPVEYNRLYDKFQNLNKMLDMAHSTVLNNLLERTGGKDVIIDQFMKKNLKVVGDWEKVNFKQVTKAEKYTAVAAASILARAAFNEWFEENQIDGIVLPKGASTNVEKFASLMKKKFGLEYFDDKAKLHFKTIKKI